ARFVLSEDTSPMILGPVGAQRWSYAAAKQLLERVIYAYGFEQGLEYTIVRPFNFIGPRMDYIPGIDGSGLPRVLACFMEALMSRKPLKLVDGGRARRCFTYIDDAVDALVRMLERPDAAKGRIFNVGHPGNEVTIAGLAEKMLSIYRELCPRAAHDIPEVERVSGEAFYGAGYEDSDRRMPDITKARLLLGWEPQTDLDTALRFTMAQYIREYGADCAPREAC
ncbi:MAG: NAD-dependent epimerase/dehydratase family protein, partial [Chitinivibrionales bacterium]|nr:NAD-dependent epimerase/dehydratase family protein [Chitinivibrionales bacterium]MBD3396528.1 NAD-dependent epimerase/dehydratase family protein [Chitinivibrionales bacterium]